MSKLSLEAQSEAIAELTTLTEELAGHLDSLRECADDEDLAARVTRAAARSLTSVRQDALTNARELNSRLRRLATHPKLSDPRIVSSVLPDVLNEAAANVESVEAVLQRLDHLDASLDMLELAHRLQVALSAAERSTASLGGGLTALRQAEKEPVPGADLLFSQRGWRQSGEAAVAWLQMHVGSEGRQFATVFAMDQRNMVLNSSTRRAPWARWDILEFTFADVAVSEVSGIRLQFS